MELNQILLVLSIIGLVLVCIEYLKDSTKVTSIATHRSARETQVYIVRNKKYELFGSFSDPQKGDDVAAALSKKHRVPIINLREFL